MKKKLLLPTLALVMTASFMMATPGMAGTVSDRLASWGIDADLELFSAKFFNNSKIRGGYNYEVEPSYNNGLYTRFDRYFFNLNLGNKGVSSIKNVQSSEFSLGLMMRHGLELQFARQFEQSEEAMKALPYTFKNLPLDSKRAIENLKIGDFVTLKSELALLVGADFVKALNWNHLGLTASANYVISGEFQVHVLKLPENKVRLKLVGLRSKATETRAGIGYASVLKIFAVKVIDKQITRILDLNPLELKFNTGKANIFMVDYVLDLKDLGVSRAYDQVLSQTKQFETLKIMNPSGNFALLQNRLAVDISAIDNIFVSDKALGGTTNRVQRSFRGSADSKYKESGLDLGIKLVRMGEERRYAENKISSISDDETREYFLLNSYKVRSESSFLMSFLKMTRETQLNSLMRADSNYEDLTAENIVMSFEKKDKRFRRAELKATQNQLQRTIPARIYNQINFSKWNSADERIRNNVAVRYQVVLHPDAVAAAPQIDKAEITKRYLEYLKQVPYTSKMTAGKTSTMSAEEALERRVSKIAAKLEEVFSSKNSDSDRVEALMELRTNSLFGSTGSGFLLSLLPQHKLEDLIYFSLSMESSDGDRIDYTFGNKPVSPIYKKLLYIQSILDNDGLDVRLESESIGTSLKQAQMN